MRKKEKRSFNIVTITRVSVSNSPKNHLPRFGPIPERKSKIGVRWRSRGGGGVRAFNVKSSEGEKKPTSGGVEGPEVESLKGGRGEAAI